MNKNKSRKTYLIKNTIIFTISSFATKFLSFFLVPIYTNKLTTVEYGIVDLLFTVCSFLYPLFTLNIAEGIYRFSLDKNSNNNDINSIGFLCIILCILLGLVMIPILQKFPNYSDYSILFYIYLVTFSVSQILLVSLKGQEKLKLFSLGNILNTLLIAIFNIIFLIGFDKGINGYFISYILANICVIIFSFIFGNQYSSLKNFNFDKKLFKDITKYSIVLIPTSFMWWIVNFSDRIMISNYIGLSANGIYAISYKIPSLLTMISSVFTQAWVFSAINEKDSEDKEKYTNSIFQNFFLILCFMGIVIVFFIKLIFKFYVSIDFFGAWKYVPFLILGYVFMTSSTFVSTSYNVHKDSKGFLISGFMGAVINIILNILFIPLFKVYGAALATSLSYIAVFIYRIIDTKKYVKISFGFNQIFQVICLLISCILAYVDNYLGFILKLIIIIIMLLVYRKILIVSFLDIIKTINYKIKNVLRRRKYEKI